MATGPVEAMRETLDHELARLSAQIDRPAWECLFGEETGQDAARGLWQQFVELYPQAAERAGTDDRDSVTSLLNLLDALDDADRVDWFARLAARDHPDEHDALRPLAFARLSVERPELPAVAWRAGVWRYGRQRLHALESQAAADAEVGARLWLSGFRQPRHRELFDELAGRLDADEAPMAALVAGGLAADAAADRPLSRDDADDIVAAVRRGTDRGGG